jgi:predicted DNA-binding transcriptional regulator AlpA
MASNPKEQQTNIEERYLDVHEAAEMLDVSEKELWDLVHHHQVPTHTIAGAFLRFRKDDIEELKIKWRIERELFPERGPSFAHNRTFAKPATLDKLRDFWYFNDFYIICLMLTMVLLYFIISSSR